MQVYTIDKYTSNVRIDRMIRKHLARLSLSAVYRYIRVGKVKVNGKRVSHNYRLQEGDRVEIYFSDDDIVAEKKVLPEKVINLVHTEYYRKNFNIVYEDERLIVCNKPSGLVVHGGTGHTRHDTLIDLAASHVRHISKNKNAVLEPVLAHRIDRDTSGIILIAKDKQILRDIHTSIRNRDIKKLYVAFCHGHFEKREGMIDVPLTRTREPEIGAKMIVDEKAGVKSLSSYKVVFAKNNLTKVLVDLHTGRMHQIRVHLSFLHCPILGDERYGDKERDTIIFNSYTIPKRLYLHAEQITFFHPDLNREVTFMAPLPRAFCDLENNLKRQL